MTQHVQGQAPECSSASTSATTVSVEITIGEAGGILRIQHRPAQCRLNAFGRLRIRYRCQCGVCMQDKDLEAADKVQGKSAPEKLTEKSSGSGSNLAQSPDGKLRMVLPKRKSGTNERPRLGSAQLSLHESPHPPRGLPLTLPKPSAPKS